MSTFSPGTAVSSGHGAPQIAAAPPQPRLVKAAHEFEAQMMKEFLKPLTHSDSSLGGQDDGDDTGDGAGSAGALGEFASEALGNALSQGGGFGIAASIIRKLTPAAKQSDPQVQKAVQVTLPACAQVTRNQHVDTVMKLHK